MPTLELGQAVYELVPAEGKPDYATVLAKNPEQFRSYSMAVYFWDCDTQTGVPRRRPKGVTAVPMGLFHVFDKGNGQVKPTATRNNAALHTDAMKLTGKDLVAALRSKLPALSAGIPYATHVDPFKKYYVRVNARIDRMTFIGRRTGAPAGEEGIWITYPVKITFNSKLIARCDGKPVVPPGGWSPDISVPLEFNALAKKMKEAHEAAMESGD